jgi:Uma2 family endonuclease
VGEHGGKPDGSTEKRDRGPKMETYARYGIEEYWLVDLGKRAIEIYRLDKKARAYRLAETYREADKAATSLLPTLSVDVGSLFAD